MQIGGLCNHIFHSYRTHKKECGAVYLYSLRRSSLFLCRKADLIFVFNDEFKHDLISKGFQTDKILITGNGVEHEFIDSVKNKYQ